MRKGVGRREVNTDFLQACAQAEFVIQIPATALGCRDLCGSPEASAREVLQTVSLPLSVLLQVTAYFPALPDTKCRLPEPKMFFHELAKLLSMALDFMTIRLRSALPWDFL